MKEIVREFKNFIREVKKIATELRQIRMLLEKVAVDGADGLLSTRTVEDDAD